MVSLLIKVLPLIIFLALSFYSLRQVIRSKKIVKSEEFGGFIENLMYAVISLILWAILHISWSYAFDIGRISSNTAAWFHYYPDHFLVILAMIFIARGTKKLLDLNEKFS